jgi:uncharacterized membrane protein
MGTWLTVWFVIGILTTVAMIAFLIALTRHVLLLGRTARRMQEEVGPIASEITSGMDRASSRAAGLKVPAFRTRRS